ncbi:hypothetical protein HYU07_02275 [Candidatus Woesearchaeota archaeon]|nr:hypothetical protein [Candidatus Woesearchaeota archaeon]
MKTIVDRLSKVAVDMLEKIPDGIEIIMNKAGNNFVMAPVDYCSNLVSLFEFIAIHRGTSDDLYYLGVAQLKLGDENEDEKSVLLYRRAIKNLELSTKTDKKKHHLNFYFLGEAQYSLAEECQLDDREKIQLYGQAAENFEKSMQLKRRGNRYDYLWLGKAQLQLGDLLTDQKLHDESIKNLETALKRSKNKDPECFYWLGLAQYSSTDALLGPEKRLRHEEAIKNFQHAASLEEDADYYYFLGEALMSFAEDAFDFLQKRILLEDSIANLDKSYSLKKDPETLETINEAKSMLFGQQGV